jgi:hypothetical protein
MKKNRIITWITAALAGVTLSCNDWLDVASETLVVDDEMFATYDGYREALNGIYLSCGAPALYGRNLTWGMASVMGQEYIHDDLALSYKQLASGDYESDEVNGMANAIWSAAYKVIANCNHLIANTAKRDSSFFPGKKNEKDLILGEARGLRALLHFEMLRLFAPAPVTGDLATPYIPYVTTYPDHAPRRLPVPEALDSIIADLTFAAEHLAYNDTVYNKARITLPHARFTSVVASGERDDGVFFAFRGARLNYYAATGLLARVNLYKGDRASALRHAEELYRHAALFPFTPGSQLNTALPEAMDRKLYHDILLAFYNPNERNLLNSERSASNYLCRDVIPGEPEFIFGNERDDYRFKYLISNSESLKWATPSGASGLQELQYSLLPVIRESEMYYIICECIADTDLPRAVALLEYVRLYRGVLDPLPSVPDRAAFMQHLLNEQRREYLVEGQTFALYKRLDIPLYLADKPVPKVMPLPTSETLY